MKITRVRRGVAALVVLAAVAALVIMVAPAFGPSEQRLRGVELP